jgi:hypothetical protein
MENFWKIENSGIGGRFNARIHKMPSVDNFFFMAGQWVKNPEMRLIPLRQFIRQS